MLEKENIAKKFLMKTKNIPSNIKSKKPYTSPVLKCFGALKDLTTGGTPGAPETLPPEAEAQVPPGVPRRP